MLNTMGPRPESTMRSGYSRESSLKKMLSKTHKSESIKNSAFCAIITQIIYCVVLREYREYVRMLYVNSLKLSKL